MHWQEIKYKKIAFKALDWGMGHTTRSLSILKQLVQLENELIVFGTKKQLEIYSNYSIQAEFIESEEISWNFRSNRNRVFEGFSLLQVLQKKRKQSQNDIEFLTNRPIDIILSDHDYGFYSKKCPSVFITHQINLPTSQNGIINRIHHKWMKNFHSFWIVDDEQINLAGKLSKNEYLTKNGKKAQYIGLQSRFQNIVQKEQILIPLLLVVSGPQPYSVELLKILIDFLNENIGVNFHAICPSNVQIDHPQITYAINDAEADNWFINAETIISRSGYTSLMDCFVLNKKAILIATKGQKEQAYLTDHNSKKYNWSLFQAKEKDLFKQALGESFFGKVI